MAINLEMPKKMQAVIEKGHQGAAEIFRPISRKYDLAEHAYPVELETIAAPAAYKGRWGPGTLVTATL